MWKTKVMKIETEKGNKSLKIKIEDECMIGVEKCD